MKKNIPLVLFLLLLTGLAQSQHQNILIGNQRDPNEPAIVINPLNPDHMMVGANLDNFYFSEDGGYSWSDNRLASATLGVWGDPCLLVDNEGHYYYFHLSNPPGPAWIDRIVCQKTTDNGINWTQGVGIGINGEKEQDKEWAVFDIVTNSIYVTWTQFDNYGSSEPSDSSNILFSSSKDLGFTWSVPVRINKAAGDCYDNDNTVEGAVPAIGPEGQIYVAWAGPLGIMFDKSLDGGLTWLENDIFIADMPGGWAYSIPGISRANGLPVTVCDLSNGPGRGTIYINWSDQRNGSSDTDIWMVKSVDDGETWSVPARVNNDPPGKQQFFTWMTIDQETGKLWFVFYDRRNHEDILTDVYLAVSEDGGDTFTNFKISESPFFPDDGIFFGDYTNISAVNDVVRPVWTRLDGDQLSLYTAIVDPLVTSVPSNEVFADLNFGSYPNPFRKTLTISFKMNTAAIVNLSLFNSKGQCVERIIDAKRIDEGRYIQSFDASGHHLPPGVYYFSLASENLRLLRKVILLP